MRAKKPTNSKPIVADLLAPSRLIVSLMEAEANLNAAADQNLLLKAMEVLRDELNYGSENNRFGWWNERLFSIDRLRELLASANNRHDYRASLAYSAMLIYRLS